MILAIQKCLRKPISLSFFGHDNSSLSACITTSGAERVAVVDLVAAVTLGTGGGHVGLLHAAEGNSGRVVLGADLVVETRVRGVVRNAAFGDVLAVRLASVVDDLTRC